MDSDTIDVGRLMLRPCVTGPFDATRQRLARTGYDTKRFNVTGERGEGREGGRRHLIGGRFDASTQHHA